MRFEKTATPLTAATVVVPDRVPPVGLAPIATVTLVLALDTVFPYTSCTVTATRLVAAPSIAAVGSRVNASFVGIWSGCVVKPPELQAQSRQRNWMAALVSFLDMASPRTVLREETVGSRFDRILPPAISSRH